MMVTSLSSSQKMVEWEWPTIKSESSATHRESIYHATKSQWDVVNQDAKSMGCGHGVWAVCPSLFRMPSGTEDVQLSRSDAVSGNVIISQTMYIYKYRWLIYVSSASEPEIFPIAVSFQLIPSYSPQNPLNLNPNAIE